MSYQNIEFEITNGIAKLTLNRPINSTASPRPCTWKCATRWP